MKLRSVAFLLAALVAAVVAIRYLPDLLGKRSRDSTDSKRAWSGEEWGEHLERYILAANPTWQLKETVVRSPAESVRRAPIVRIRTTWRSDGEEYVLRLIAYKSESIAHERFLAEAGGPSAPWVHLYLYTITEGRSFLSGDAGVDSWCARTGRMVWSVQALPEICNGIARGIQLLAESHGAQAGPAPVRPGARFDPEDKAEWARFLRHHVLAANPDWELIGTNGSGLGGRPVGDPLVSFLSHWSVDGEVHELLFTAYAWPSLAQAGFQEEVMRPAGSSELRLDSLTEGRKFEGGPPGHTSWCARTNKFVWSVGAPRHVCEGFAKGLQRAAEAYENLPAR